MPRQTSAFVRLLAALALFVLLAAGHRAWAPGNRAGPAPERHWEATTGTAGGWLAVQPARSPLPSQRPGFRPCTLAEPLPAPRPARPVLTLIGDRRSVRSAAPPRRTPLLVGIVELRI